MKKRHPRMPFFIAKIKNLLLDKAEIMSGDYH